MRLRISRTLAWLNGEIPAGERFHIDSLARGRRLANQRSIRALASNAYLGRGAALCRVLGRYKFYVDTQDVGLSSHLLLDGYWEMWTTEVIASRIKPGMVVADIGANLGYFSVLMADLVGPTGQVHAFEPNAAMAERLRRNLVVNGFGERARIHAEPLSDRDGDAVRLIVPADFPSAAHMVAVPPTGAQADAPGTMRTRRFDGYPELATVDFLKIDAEGAEQAIFEGMAGVLRAGRPLTIILEFAPVRYRDPGAFLAAIAAQGFALALIDPVRGVRTVTPEDVLADDRYAERMLLLCR